MSNNSSFIISCIYLLKPIFVAHCTGKYVKMGSKNHSSIQASSDNLSLSAVYNLLFQFSIQWTWICVCCEQMLKVRDLKLRKGRQRKLYQQRALKMERSARERMKTRWSIDSYRSKCVWTLFWKNWKVAVWKWGLGCCFSAFSPEV